MMLMSTNLYVFFSFLVSFYYLNTSDYVLSWFEQGKAKQSKVLEVFLWFQLESLLDLLNRRTCGITFGLLT